jgi:hypothetical protein
MSASAGPMTDLDSPAAGRLKRAGWIVALAGVVASVLVGWIAAATLDLPGTYEWYGVWHGWFSAAVITATLCLVSLGLGTYVSFLPEFRRRGSFARRLLAAEHRNLRAGRGPVAFAVWGVLLGAGLLFFAMCGGYGFDAGNTGYGPAMLWFIVPCFASWGLSVLVPLIVAVSAAVSLAGSRRSGAARDLLLSPPAADTLGWALARAHARRGVWMLLAALPWFATTLLIFGQEVRYSSETDPVLTGLVVRVPR